MEEFNYSTWEEFCADLLKKSKVRGEEGNNYYLAFIITRDYSRGSQIENALQRILHSYKNKQEIIDAYKRFELLSELKSLG